MQGNDEKLPDNPLATYISKIKINFVNESSNIFIDMIHEHDPITNMFVSVPADMSQFNAASFLAGIIRGILDSAMFVSNAYMHVMLYIMSHT